MYLEKAKHSHFRLLVWMLAGFLMCFANRAQAETGKLGKELYFASLSFDIDEMKKLIAQGADVNHLENGRPILGWAAQNGNAEIVTLLLKSGANPNIADTGVGHTPLMRAIDTQSLEVVVALLKGKADPNAKDKDGNPCLMLAVSSHKPKIVKALLVSGADPKWVSAEGESPVLAAAQDGMEESLEIIRLLGKAGAEMNASNAAYTPLIYAISQDNSKLVEELLAAGANPNAKTQSGSLPLEKAMSNEEIFSQLIKAKADVNAKNDEGETMLISAIRNAQPKAVKALLDAGADKSVPSKSGESPFEIAKNTYNQEIIDLFASAVKDQQSNPSEVGGYKVYPAEGQNGNCSIADAARKQMEIHGKLQEEVNAGKRSDNIFRTFNDDTKDFGELLVNDPGEACRFLDRLAAKYGVK